jgi:hypothetical protein
MVPAAGLPQRLPVMPVALILAVTPAVLISALAPVA